MKNTLKKFTTLKEFGALIKSLRLDLGYTLRAFCQAKSVDIVAQSRLERGFLDIDENFDLKKIATALETTPADLQKALKLTEELLAILIKLKVEPLSDEEISGQLPSSISRLNKLSQEEKEKLADKLMKDWGH